MVDGKAWRGLALVSMLLLSAPARAEEGEAEARVLSAVEMLMAGAQANRLDVVLHFLARGVDVNAAAKNGFTPLIVAAGAGSEDVIEALLAHGADVNRANAEGWTALMEAAYGDRPAIVKRLLRAGASVTDRERRNGFTALMVAARGDQPASVTALSDAGSEIDAADERGGMTALHLALASRKKASAQIAAELLVRGADAGKPARDGTTPLMAAIRSGKLSKVTLVLSEKVEVSAEAPDGRSALSEAAALGHDAIVRQLLTSGATPDAVSGEVTPLTEAIRSGSAVAIELLLDAGADPARPGRGGKTPLQLAALTGDEALAALLLDRGAPVNGRNPGDGTTALMWAANGGYRGLVELLIDRGADISIVADDGWTAGEAARMAGHDEIARLLERQT